MSSVKYNSSVIFKLLVIFHQKDTDIVRALFHKQEEKFLSVEYSINTTKILLVDSANFLLMEYSSVEYSINCKLTESFDCGILHQHDENIVHGIFTITVLLLENYIKRRRSCNLMSSKDSDTVTSIFKCNSYNTIKS